MNLKAYLATINMTMKDFGEYMDISPRYLSGIAKGKLVPSVRLAKAIENATDGEVKLVASKKIRRGRLQVKQQQQEVISVM